VTAATTLAVLGLLQTASQKIELLDNVLTVELVVLVLLFGGGSPADGAATPSPS